MLQLNQVSKVIQEKQILENITFSVEAGEFVTLIGPSGSGKSTIFSLIGGMLAPDSGDISLRKQSIIKQRGHISYMPQEDTLFPWRTVLQNILLVQELQGNADQEKAYRMLHKAGLQSVTHAYPYELSGGMKQRVSFIRALLSPQSLLCLDEPFSALDEFTRMDMQQWLLSIWKQSNASILFVTHHIEEALFLSDKIVVLTEAPGEVKGMLEIPFSRPRKRNLLLTEEFLKWKKQVLNMIWRT
ncbi:MAG TPA: ABC transporter ATP-binding protein [Pseudogracilibacillus sp.]|nr:ABC transporter ATP-binding protein [Pseudogracilibacillus sp.]